MPAKIFINRYLMKIIWNTISLKKSAILPLFAVWFLLWMRETPQKIKLLFNEELSLGREKGK